MKSDTVSTVSPSLWCFRGGSDDKASACSVGDPDSIPGLGRSPGEGNSYLVQYSGLEHPMDCIVHGVTKRVKILINFRFLTGWANVK